MFGGIRNVGGLGLNKSTSNEEAESFLRHHEPGQPQRVPRSPQALWPWVLSTSFFALLSLALLAFQIVPSETGNYEVGFDTELGS